MENQSLAGHGSALRIAQFRRRAGVPVSTYSPVAPEYTKLLPGPAPALGRQHHVTRRRHAIHLRLPAAVCLVISRRHQQQLHRIGGRRRRSRLRNHRAQRPSAHHRPALGIGVFQFAAAHADH
jgi:hypothetical protein